MTTTRPAWQRVLALLLCLVFCWCYVGYDTARAIAPLVIAGVVIGGEAILAFVVSALIIGLVGAELETALEDAAAANNQTVKQYVGTKLREYVAATGSAVDTIKNFLIRGMSYTSDGLLVFNQAVSDWIYAFGQWCLADGGLNQYVASGEELTNGAGFNFVRLTYDSTVTVGNYQYSYCDYILGSVNGRNFVISSTSSNASTLSGLECIVTQYNGRLYYATLDNWSHMVRLAYADDLLSNAAINGSENNRGKLYWQMPGSDSFTWNVPISTKNPTSLSSVDGLTSIGGADINLDVLDGGTSGIVIDGIGVLGDAVSDLTGAVANIGDYVNTLADALTGVADITLPLVDGTTVPIAVPANPAIVINPAADVALDETYPVTGENDDPDIPYPGTDDYSLPLASFFPFCIPFDIYDMFAMFSASAEAPKFELPLSYPGVIDEKIVVDLSAFDDVAAGLRNLETIIFCVGLAFATKKLLFGS